MVVSDGGPSTERVRYIAGADVAFDKPNRRGVGVVVVLEWPSLDVAECVCVEQPVTFPYVPGLLSFRETPVVLPAFERLTLTPDLLMVDGHGYAHPRRFGFACHIGLLLDIPTIGVAKSRLVGAHAGLPVHRGARADLTDDGEVIASVLRTRDGVRPIYVSVGHRISLPTAEQWALQCARVRVPEPTRVADRVAGEAKRRMLALTLEMVIEQRPGDTQRWEYQPDTGEFTFERDDLPFPCYYGCSTTLVNAADAERLDIMLVDSARHEGAARHERGDALWVRVVDVLRKVDGDDKLLAVPADGSDLVVPDCERAAIWRWFKDRDRPITGWDGEDAALALITSCEARP
jgi:deoxyribonuclease V